MWNGDILGKSEVPVLDFEIRLVLGPFFKAILHCCKLRGEKYENTQYDLFSKFAGALSGEKYDFSDRNSQTRISNLINCTRWPRLLDSDIEKTVKQHFVSRLKAMRGFLNEYCDTDRLNETVAILKVLLEKDDTIAKDEELFISNVPEAGKCIMTTADEILKAKEFDFALFLLSLSCYVWDLENKDGRETVDEEHWKAITDPDVLAPYLADMKDLENGVPLVNPSRIIGKKQDEKGLNPCLTDLDFNALQSQVKDNPDLSSLVSNTQRNRKLYVETGIYREALEKVLKKGRVMLSGPPGSGKTRTSEMVALKMAGLGYRVSFLYGSAEVNDFYTSLIKEKNTGRHFILIDDCMGQAYYDLNRNEAETPLQKLISYVGLFPMRYKLLLNSRINIIEESGKYRIGKDVISELKQADCFVRANVLSLCERALILKKHLIVRTDREHYLDIGSNGKLCLKIVHHEPFLPRVIDHVTEKASIGGIINSGDYARKILAALKNPSAVWDEIYFSASQASRALLMSLYSITKTDCNMDECLEVFNHLVCLHKENADTHLLWNKAVSSMNESMITISDRFGKKKIGFYDPSVRDYLRESVYTDSHSRDELLNCMLHFGQLECIFDGRDEEEKEACVFRLTGEGKLADLLYYDGDDEKIRTIVSWATKTVTLNAEYKDYFKCFINRNDIRYTFPARDHFYLLNEDILSLMIEHPEVPKFYYGNGIPEELFEKLIHDMTIETACYLIPIILKKPQAFAFDFGEDQMMTLIYHAVNNSMVTGAGVGEVYAFYEGDYDDMNRAIHECREEYCKSIVADEGEDLPDEIKRMFTEMIADSPIEDFTDEIEWYREQAAKSDEDESDSEEETSEEMSDEEILELFRDPFPGDK